MPEPRAHWYWSWSPLLQFVTDISRASEPQPQSEREREARTADLASGVSGGQAAHAEPTAARSGSCASRPATVSSHDCCCCLGVALELLLALEETARRPRSHLRPVHPALRSVSRPMQMHNHAPRESRGPHPPDSGPAATHRPQRSASKCVYSVRGPHCVYVVYPPFVKREKKTKDCGPVGPIFLFSGCNSWLYPGPFGQQVGTLEGYAQGGWRLL